MSLNSVNDSLCRLRCRLVQKEFGDARRGCSRSLRGMWVVQDPLLDSLDYSVPLLSRTNVRCGDARPSSSRVCTRSIRWLLRRRYSCSAAGRRVDSVFLLFFLSSYWIEGLVEEIMLLEGVVVGKRPVYNPRVVPTSKPSCVPPCCLWFPSVWVWVLFAEFLGYGHEDGLIIFVMTSPIRGGIY